VISLMELHSAASPAGAQRVATSGCLGRAPVRVGQ
jgi:hypothetical protein